MQSDFARRLESGKRNHFAAGKHFARLQETVDRPRQQRRFGGARNDLRPESLREASGVAFVIAIGHEHLGKTTATSDLRNVTKNELK
jgi:hypothetical protein